MEKKHLLHMQKRLVPIEEIALVLQRSQSACQSQLRRLRGQENNPKFLMRAVNHKREDILAAQRLLSLLQSK